MATQDNDAAIIFGTTTAEIARPQKYRIYTALAAGTAKSEWEDLGSFVDDDGNPITTATIASGTVVDIDAGNFDLNLTTGDLNESGRGDVIESIVGYGWYVALGDGSDNELTGASGLTRQAIAAANFS